MVQRLHQQAQDIKAGEDESKEKHWRATHHLFDQLNTYPADKSALTGWRNLDRVKDISDFFGTDKIGISAGIPSINGGFIWGAWIDDEDCDVGFTSDNPALFISSAKFFEIANRDSIRTTEAYHRVISIWPA